MTIATGVARTLGSNCVVAILLVIPSQFGWAQSVPPGWGSLAWYKQNTETVLANARRMIEPTLSTEDRNIARSIRYRVTAQPGIGAFAAWEDGRRLALISAGFVQVSEWMAEAIIFEQELGAIGCFGEYSSYLGERLIENSERVGQGLPARVAYNPLLFAQREGGSCADISPREFQSRPDLGEYRAKMVEASIVFLYLHELAHHTLGHIKTPGLSDSSNLEVRREREDAADRWAILTAIAADYNLLAAMPVFSLIALVGGNSLESERLMSHPLGIRRFLSLYEEISSYLEDNPDSWHGEQPLDELLFDLEEQRYELEEALGELE